MYVLYYPIMHFVMVYFSAHTARVVAGMIYKVRRTHCFESDGVHLTSFKVGILAKDNIDHVHFAFDTYMTTGYEGYKLSRDFKQNFA